MQNRFVMQATNLGKMTETIIISPEALLYCSACPHFDNILRVYENILQPLLIT